MSKSIKLKNDTYLDTSSIVHNKKLLSTILELKVDTGKEIATNEYMDEKQVFMKRIRTGALSGTTLTVSHGITGASRIWIDAGNSYGVGSDTNVVPLPYVNTNSDYAIQLYLGTSAGTIIMRSTSQRLSDSYVTLKYIK